MHVRLLKRPPSRFCHTYVLSRSFVSLSIKQFTNLYAPLQLWLSQQRMPSSNLAAFRQEYRNANNVVVLTGAGVSAESGVPTFRGAGGFWRRWQAQDLATPEAFERDPSLVWEFYHYRREVMFSKSPNPAHYSIAEAQRSLKAQGKTL